MTVPLGWCRWRPLIQRRSPRFSILVSSILSCPGWQSWLTPVQDSPCPSCPASCFLPSTQDTHHHSHSQLNPSRSSSIFLSSSLPPTHFDLHKPLARRTFSSRQPTLLTHSPFSSLDLPPHIASVHCRRFISVTKRFLCRTTLCSLDLPTLSASSRCNCTAADGRIPPPLEPLAPFSAYAFRLIQHRSPTAPQRHLTPHVLAPKASGCAAYPDLSGRCRPVPAARLRRIKSLTREQLDLQARRARPSASVREGRPASQLCPDPQHCEPAEAQVGRSGCSSH